MSWQAAHLENWEALEEEHSSALSGAMEALEAAILRVPVTGGAKVCRNFTMILNQAPCYYLQDE